jgi:ABC-type sugar transport system ATPase subunit
MRFAAVGSAKRASPREKSVLKMSGITKRYGQAIVLDSVDLAVEAGEVMALMGENGAGKSTLVKILAGIETAESGTIEIAGQAAPIGSPQQSRAAGVSYVAQELSIIQSMSVAENVLLGDAGTVFRSPAQLARKAAPYLAQVGLGHIEPLDLCERLSVAEQQLVEIARLLSRKARIAILDEPTAALSDAEIARVKEAVRTLSREGCAVIYVTHRMPEVFDMTHRVTVLRNGRSFPSLATKDLSVDMLIEHMLGRRLENMFPPRAASLGAIVLTLDNCLAPGLNAPVSLAVRQGEIVGLSGQLGSGANSVLRAAAGILPLHSGRMELGARDYAPRRVADSIKARVAYCSDDRKRDGVFAVRGVPENLSAPALGAISRFSFLSRRREREHTAHIGARFGIDKGVFSRLAGNLSGGNQQKVALGKWIGVRPRLLLVEEPTRGVDVGARAEIYRHLRKLADEGLCVIFASSDTQEVLGLADTIATFFHGELVRVLNAGEASAQDITRDVTRAAAQAA